LPASLKGSRHQLPRCGAAALLLRVLISLVSHAMIERPARTRIRSLLAPRGAPVLGA
jgi:peptidoglycan/LPS O-acetylase OafA/YrhL